MANILLAYPNRADAATLSGGDWETTLPAANLLDRRQHIPARTTSADLADTQLDIALDKSRLVGLIALYRHNLSTTAQIRIRAGEDNTFAVTEYDSGWMDVWPVIYDTATLQWENEAWWDGKHTDETREGFPAVWLHVLPDATFCRYWRIEIDDQTNAAGYIEAARLWLSETWEPRWNYSHGAQFGVMTGTQVVQALSGAEYFDRRDPARTFVFSLDWLTEAEGYQRAFELQWRQGIDQEVFVIPDPDDSINLIRRAFLARQNQLNPIDHPRYATLSNAISLKELL